MTPAEKPKHSFALERVVSNILDIGAEVRIRTNLYNAITGMIANGIVKVDGESTSMRMWEVGYCTWAFYNSASRDMYLFTGDVETGKVVYQKFQ